MFCTDHVSLCKNIFKYSVRRRHPWGPHLFEYGQSVFLCCSASVVLMWYLFFYLCKRNIRRSPCSNQYLFAAFGIEVMSLRWVVVHQWGFVRVFIKGGTHYNVLELVNPDPEFLSLGPIPPYVKKEPSAQQHQKQCEWVCRNWTAILKGSQYQQKGRI